MSVCLCRYTVYVYGIYKDSHIRLYEIHTCIERKYNSSILYPFVWIIYEFGCPWKKETAFLPPLHFSEHAFRISVCSHRHRQSSLFPSFLHIKKEESKKKYLFYSSPLSSSSSSSSISSPSSPSVFWLFSLLPSSFSLSRNRIYGRCSENRDSPGFLSGEQVCFRMGLEEHREGRRLRHLHRRQQEVKWNRRDAPVAGKWIS